MYQWRNGGGYCFVYSQQHDDEDDGYSMLSAVGQPSGRGEFYSSEVGRAHVVVVCLWVCVCRVSHHTYVCMRV